jgi:pimeloyl-ACP methyl ester carboxylesterase
MVSHPERASILKDRSLIIRFIQKGLGCISVPTWVDKRKFLFCVYQIGLACCSGFGRKSTLKFQHENRGENLSGDNVMNLRISTALLSLLALVLVCNGRAQQAPNDAPVVPPLTSVPTFSTANIARQGHFYVGGKWVGKPGEEIMRGAMYVETWVPKKIRYKYPIVFIQSGGGQTNVALLQTPDGRPGWAYDFVNRGYVIYMLDLPGRGRSAYVPGVDGELLPPRSGPLMEEVWSNGRPPATPQSTWPQHTKQTQWPGDGPNKGKMGDPIFDYYAKTDSQTPTAKDLERLTADDVVELIDLIHQPVILLLHSGVAPSGWQRMPGRSWSRALLPPNLSPRPSITRKGEQ